MLSPPYCCVSPAATTYAAPPSETFGPSPASSPDAVRRPDEEAEAGEEEALLQPADERDELGNAAQPRISHEQTRLELPPELRDDGGRIEVVAELLVEPVDEVPGEVGDAEAGAGEPERFRRDVRHTGVRFGLCSDTGGTEEGDEKGEEEAHRGRR